MRKSQLLKRAAKIGMNQTEASKLIDELAALSPMAAANAFHYWNLITTDRQYNLIVERGVI